MQERLLQGAKLLEFYGLKYYVLLHYYSCQFPIKIVSSELVALLGLYFDKLEIVP